MDVFTAAPHEDLLVLLLQVGVLLLFARGLAEIAQRLGQPSVVGEILAGIVLGPSILSGAFPEIGRWLVPQTPVQGYLLESVGLFGAMFLLLITGLETDLALIRRHARTAIGVSAGGILVTLASGFALGQWIPDELLADPDQRLVFSLFVATAMSISAIPVIAKVLFDLNLMRRDVGQTIIAAGMSDDTNGWILLSIIIGIAGGEAISAAGVGQAVGKVFVFLGLSFTLGRWLVRRLLVFVQDEVTIPDRLLTLSVILMFLWAALSQSLQLEPVLGAFVIGILLGQMPRFPEAARHALQSLALAIFAPIFFAVSGLKVNLRSLLDPDLALVAVAVIAVAAAGKIVGTYLGARLIGGRDHWTALSFGAGLNARGAMEIIIATIGLSLGILSQDMFSIIVVMAIATSLMAPSSLRWVLRRVKPAEEELARLRQEEIAGGSRIAAIHRVLLPVRPGGDARPTQAAEATVLAKMAGKARLSITFLTVTDTGRRADAGRFLERLAKDFSAAEVVTKVVESARPADVVLEEAQKGYDLLVLGGSDLRGGSDVLFSPLIDYLVRSAPCATLVVQGRSGHVEWAPRRILVPSNGSTASKHAAELAYALAGSEDEEVLLLHVVRQERGFWRYGPRAAAALESQMTIGRQMLEEIAGIGRSLGVLTQSEVRLAAEPERVILDLAREGGFDLIVLGTDLRLGSGRLFFGPRVERILGEARCPVILFNAP